MWFGYCLFCCIQLYDFSLLYCSHASYYRTDDASSICQVVVDKNFIIVQESVLFGGLLEL